MINTFKSSIISVRFEPLSLSYNILLMMYRVLVIAPLACRSSVFDKKNDLKLSHEDLHLAMN